MAQAQSKTVDPPEDKTADLAVVVIDPKTMVSLPFKGKVYTFKRKRIEAVQFRKRMQQRLDADAVEWLLGEQQFDRLMEDTADEDGCTSVEVWGEFFDALGEAVGTGNS
jgi:hypothetical protein